MARGISRFLIITPMLLRLATHAMGTRFELVLLGEDEPRTRAAGEGAIREIEDWHRRLSRFAPDSQLSFINRTAAVRPVPIDQDLFDLLAVCARAHAATGGAFDPTVAPVLDRLGLTNDQECGQGNTIGMHSVLLDPAHRTVSFATPGLTLDLGGVAKGFALDHAARLLRENGIRQALLHGGTSSIIAIGQPADAPAWRIAVQGDSSQIEVDLTDAALSVSAPRGRTTQHHGRTIGHIIDPRSLEALPPGRTAAVIAHFGCNAQRAPAPFAPKERRDVATGGVGAPPTEPVVAHGIDPSPRRGEGRLAPVLASNGTHLIGSITEMWSTALTVLGARPPTIEPELTSAIHDPGGEWRIEGDHAHLFAPSRKHGQRPEAA